MNNTVHFTINGKKYIVGQEVASDTSLNNYIRNYAELRGTKAMCHEGGCGACVVAANITHPVTKEEQIVAVNSCLVPVLLCHEWAITTVEGIGNKKDGYHAMQTRLAGFNGTQCGYCTPGWVMNMYSIFQGKKQKMTMKEIENSFAGNICRCTGYRPIADAFKSFAKDAPQALLDKVQDIEDMNSVVCAKTNKICTKTCSDYDSEIDWCKINMQRTFKKFSVDANYIEINLSDGHKWYKVYNVQDIFRILDKDGYNNYMLVAGNTGQGVYRIDTYPKTMIDISQVEDLRTHEIDVNLVVGGSVTLSELMEIFQKLAASNQNFSYLKEFYKHLDLVAHFPVRNIGTIAGNLSLKHEHRDFQSDVFLLLETVGAMLTLLSKNGSTQVTMLQYLDTNMIGKVIYNVIIPPLSSRSLLRTYKIMPRAQNAHAIVNAGFLYEMDATLTRVNKATIVFGSISPSFVHATNTENLLHGKNLFDTSVIQMAVKSLFNELNPEKAPPEPSPKTRKRLALGLFYKGILSLCPAEKVLPRNLSGAFIFDRPVSKATKTYDTEKAMWPVNKPIPKIEALVQCSGEGKFVNDLPAQPHEVYAAFVLTDVYNGEIIGFDPSAAMALKGVVAFYTAKDIPGTNTFTPTAAALQTHNEEILCSKKVLFHSQPAAIIVADTEKLANKAAKLVKIRYKNVNTTKKPTITIRQAMKAPKSENRIITDSTIQPTERGNNVVSVLMGSYDIFGQYHYTMETQTCVVIPSEDGFDVYSSTQSMDLANIAIAQALKIPENSINLQVRRVGGGYGCKITRASQIATSCALVAKLLNRPCRFVLSLETNMKAIGNRLPTSCDYEVGIDGYGEIQYLKHMFYQNNGSSLNESGTGLTVEHFYNCYDHKRWFVQANTVLTDTPSNTWCRAPSSCEGVAMIEHIMEHITQSIKGDPIDVRLRNMRKDDNPLPDLIAKMRIETNYDNRAKSVQDFNRNNRWVKRGIKMLPMSYGLNHYGNFEALISIYHADGTVAVAHGGIEMGQGLNTKVAQVVAYTLGIPLEKVVIKPSNNFDSPNTFVSGGSMASESVCYAAMKACNNLLEKLAPLKVEMTNPTWEELVAKAYASGISLQTSYMSVDTELENYNIFGLTVLEVEVDILTGNHQVLRVDILEDTGRSLSPEVDLGQIEGSFIMGLGYWTSEKLVFDDMTGANLTHRTWTYKPPGIKDIPLDMRVKFQRNDANPVGFLRSKATGEPPLCMAVVITHAMRQAIMSARVDAGLPEQWFNIDLPYTNDNILAAVKTRLEDYVL